MRAFLAATLCGAALVACGQGHLPDAVSPADDPAVEASTGPTPPGQVSPIALRIPSIGVNSRDWMVVGVQPNGVIESPPVTKPRLLGWYCPLWRDTQGVDCGAPVPGDTGPAVILGHINGGGTPGVFARLSEVKVGARIEIDRSDGYTAVFKVTRAEQPLKTRFPTQAVYADTPDAQLRVISCGGELDVARRSYKGQVIRYAALETLSPTELRPR